mmetsp:Transcript_92941/g.161058  ORF Transcript_92941/g.161058 Transcript_92941/m.161058 type:complete len:261 (-) Transcript_92941:112-894(-)
MAWNLAPKRAFVPSQNRSHGTCCSSGRSSMARRRMRRLDCGMHFSCGTSIQALVAGSTASRPSPRGSNTESATMRLMASTSSIWAWAARIWSRNAAKLRGAGFGFSGSGGGSGSQSHRSSCLASSPHPSAGLLVVPGSASALFSVLSRVTSAIEATRQMAEAPSRRMVQAPSQAPVGPKRPSCRAAHAPCASHSRSARAPAPRPATTSLPPGPWGPKRWRRDPPGMVPWVGGPQSILGGRWGWWRAAGGRSLLKGLDKGS